MRRFNRRWERIACSAAVLFAFGCGHGQPGGTVPDHPGRSLTKAEVVKLGLGEKYRTRLGAAARQLIAADIGSTPEGVIVVQADPDTGSYGLTRGELNAGSVVARLSKLSPGSVRRFGLGQKDTESYMYVFLGKDGNYMGRFVSETMDTTYQITVEEHTTAEEGLDKPIPWKQSVAQFEYLGPLGGDLKKGRGDSEAGPFKLMEGGGGSLWIACMALGCCKVN